METPVTTPHSRPSCDPLATQLRPTHGPAEESQTATFVAALARPAHDRPPRWCGCKTRPILTGARHPTLLTPAMITFSCLMARTFPKYLGNRYQAEPVCTCPSDGGDANEDFVSALAAHDHGSACGLYRNPRYQYFDRFEMNEELVVVFNCPQHRVCAGCFLDTIKKIKPYQWYASGSVVSRGNVRAVLEFGDRDLVRGQAIIDAIEAIVRICVPPAVNEDRRILGGRVAINENGAYIAITNVPEYLDAQ